MTEDVRPVPKNIYGVTKLAAELYGGKVLRAGIQDDPRNFTRFYLLARDAGFSPLGLGA